jgi:hypothetical protein
LSPNEIAIGIRRLSSYPEKINIEKYSGKNVHKIKMKLVCSGKRQTSSMVIFPLAAQAVSKVGITSILLKKLKELGFWDSFMESVDRAR